ncbi:muscle M-line assembly protein unc-89-like [Clytia hemisphaerica]|uniref:Uncharacterized protein n=1 Tax=Clytia hemisphaerica TaxID=252671 RepID=A0A7M5VC89_9CNID|eukprot:TCONS_00063715-protein
MANIPPSNLPIPGQLKVPTFNTSTFRLSSDQFTKTGKIRLTTPQNTSNNVSKTKIQVDGKLIDVDVLTKLHQQAGTNATITFNSSTKNLLSNIAITKLTSGARKIEPTTLKQPKTIAVTVFGSQQGSKTTHEKFLLPKTTTATKTTISKTMPYIEVKKFAPEMNGLMTALKNGHIKAENDGKNITIRNKPATAYAFNIISKDNLIKNGTFIPSTPNLNKGFQSSSNTKTLITQGPTVKRFHTNATEVTTKRLLSNNTPLTSTVHNPKATTNRKPIEYRTTPAPTYNKPSVIYNRMNVITSYQNPTTKPTLTAKPTSAIVENRAYKANKVMLENNKKANFKIKTLLLQDLMKKKAKKENDTTRIDGFEQLYNEAVNNVLKLKSFTEDGEERKKETTLKEIENDFKRYLDTPMEIEKRIEEGLFRFCRKRSSPSTPPSTNSVDIKKRKLIDEEMLNAYLKSETVSPVSMGAKTPASNPGSENFFKQFLTDKAKIPKPFKTQPYYSPNDYPWFYPTYFYQNSPSGTVSQPSSKPPKLVKIKHKSPIKNEADKMTTPKAKSPKEQKLKKGIATRSSTLKVENIKSKLSPKDIKAKKANNVNIVKNKKVIKRVSTPTKEKGRSINNEQKCSTKVLTPKKEQCTSRGHLLKPNLKPIKKPNQLSASQKRLFNKDTMKFRYSLRQRAKALKKAKKLAKKQHKERPKLVLKKFDPKKSTKKEIFLANFDLRRVLKRVPPSPVQSSEQSDDE